VVLAALACGARCKPAPPLTPAAGLPQFQELALVPVPGAAVNGAGGNLILRRTDLSIETRLGTRSIGATYNSATDQWLWSFDVSYLAGVFVDPTGHESDVSSLTPHDAIPGTVWVKVDERRIRTKGGLIHEFDAHTGRLLRVRWAGSTHPSLDYVETSVGGQPALEIRQCATAAAPCSDVFSVLYDSQGRVEEIQDRAGRRADFSYHPDGRLAVARDALDVARGWPGFRYEYGGESETLLAITNSEEERVEFSWSNGRVTTVSALGAGDPIHSFTYLPPVNGLYTTLYTDPLGFVTRLRYDAERRVADLNRYLDPSQSESDQVVYAWAGNRPTRSIDPAGVATEWAWANDDVVTTTLPCGNVVHYQYEDPATNRADPFARPLAQAWDDLGPIAQRSYDALGRIESHTNGEGETTLYGYDAEGMLASLQDPAGIVTEYRDHGEHGKPTRIVRGTREFEYDYDAVGNLTRGPSITEQSSPGWGGVVVRSFDEDRNVSELELADLVTILPTGSRTLRIEHGSDGRRLSITRPHAGDTIFVYDGLGRVVERRDRASGVGHSDWQSTRFEYDAMGRLTALERPNAMREEWTYEAAGRVETHTIARGSNIESDVVFRYEQGRLIETLDSIHGSPESRSYDGSGRLSHILFPEGEALTVLYDARSRPTQRIYWSEDASILRALAFGYDAADRPTLLRDAGQGGGFLLDLVQHVLADGRISEIRYGNGLTRTIEYDPEHGLAVAFTTTDGTQVLESTQHDYGSGWGSSGLSSTTETFGSVPLVTAEHYLLAPLQSADPLSQAGQRAWLWHATDSTFELPDSAFDYDELGNASYSFDGESWQGLVYNPERNRLLQSPLHDYTYDRAGFVVARDGVTLEWDGAGRISEIGSAASFVWDTQGSLVSSTVAGTETRRHFGGRVETDAAGTPVALDLGEVRIDLSGAATSPYRYRHYDFRNNVKFVTDDAGEVVTHHHYGLYGEVASYGDPGSTGENRNFARGRTYAGLQLLGQRLLDQDCARFLAPDPVYHLVNQYAYALGNPVWFWDPGGARSAAVSAVLGVAGGLGAAAGFALGGPTLVGNVVGAAAGSLLAQAATVQVLNMIGVETRLDLTEAAVSAAVSAVLGGARGALGRNVAPLPDVTGDRAFRLRACGKACQPPKPPESPEGGSSEVNAIGFSFGLGGGGGCGLGHELVLLALIPRYWRRKGEPSPPAGET